MAADPVIVCLQSVTDYTQFERLCSDLMVLEGYSKLEPLGGFKDSGRDAVHHCTASGQNTIFAYSVREDWRVKLDEDAKKIRKHKHPCNKLVFLCTSEFTAGARDKAIREVKTKFKWDLDLFGLERLGTLLRARHRHLIACHPQVFTPSFFPPIIAGIDPTVQDFVFIDYVDADAALATWLARRLMTAGYRPWCRALSLLPGEPAAEVMDKVIRNHACRVIALYSPTSLRDANAQTRRTLALNLTKERGMGFFIPVAATAFDRGGLDYQTKELAFVSFEQGWATGIEQLLTTLGATACPHPLSNGAALATQTFAIPGLIRNIPECLLSNCFPVTNVPEVIHSFKSDDALSRERCRELGIRWAFRTATPTRCLCFHQPPPDVADDLGLKSVGSFCWRHVSDWEGLNTRYLAMELVRKSLTVKCAERGLVLSNDTGLMWFPFDMLPKNWLSFKRPDGASGRVQVAGERSVRRSGVKVPYRYHLAPTFFVRGDLGAEFTALIKIQIHLTDSKGQPLPKRTAISRRKQLCKNWWNHEWLSRTLGIASYLAEGKPEFSVGCNEDEQIVVAALPLSWEVPVSIDEEALSPSAWERGDILPGEADDDEEDSDDESQVA
jgi:hypothetical protein